MRYERKYHIEHAHRDQVLQNIRLHPAGFREAFAERQVNNLYLDTPGLTAYHHNMQGVGQRQKQRLRWYGPEEAACPDIVFEIKIKDNQLGRKESLPLGALDWRHWPAYQALIPDAAAQGWSPTLLNAYRRRYFVTPDGLFRLTVDDQLRFAGFHGAHTRLPTYTMPDIILELKYDEAVAPQADRITQYLPFLMTKFSKYVVGLARTQL